MKITRSYRVAQWPLANGDRVIVSRMDAVNEAGYVLGRHFTWHVQARNGQLVATGGETYTRKWSALRAARRHFPEMEPIR